MIYNSRNIKKFKGKVVILSYTPKRNPLKHKNNLSGVITATTKKHLVFEPNKDNLEIMLTYDQIQGIEIPVRYETT